MVPVAGSAYTYAYATLGELFAWIIGWDLVLEYAVGVGDRRARLVRTTSRTSSAMFGMHAAGSACARRRSTTTRRRATSSSTGALVDLPAIVIVALVTVVLVKGIQESASFNAAMVVHQAGRSCCS